MIQIKCSKSLGEYTILAHIPAVHLIILNLGIISILILHSERM